MKKTPPYPKFTYHHEVTGRFVSETFHKKHPKLSRKVKSRRRNKL